MTHQPKAFPIVHQIALLNNTVINDQEMSICNYKNAFTEQVEI